jgi:DNA (cytosine-5)-methyltransferase 1
VEESAALQSFPAKFISNANDQQAYKQYGNSVNVTVIAECAKRLFDL